MWLPGSVVADSMKRILTKCKVKVAQTKADHLEIISHISRNFKNGTEYRLAYQTPIEKKIRANTVSFMALNDDVLVGSIQLMKNDGFLFSLQNMIVSRDSRRCGVASSLLAAVEAFISNNSTDLLLQRSEHRNSSIVMLELDVDRSNPPAICLYNKCGFLPKFSAGNLFNHRQKMFKIVQMQQKILKTTANTTKTASILALNTLKLISFIIIMIMIDCDFEMNSNQ